MTTVTAIDVRAIRVPLTRTFSTSNKTSTDSRLLILSLRGDDGLVGWGEAAINKTFTGETMDDAVANVTALGAERLQGRDIEEIYAVLPELAVRIPAQKAVRMAVTMAVYDLRARSLGLPLHALLGARHRDSVATTYHLGSFDAELDALDAREAVSQGFTILKMKVGRPDVLDDMAAVEKVRHGIPAATRLYVDANQAWSREQAETFIKGAESLGVNLVEQPTAVSDTRALHELSQMTDAVVAADESIHEAHQLLATIAGGLAPAGTVVKLLKAGGLGGAQSIISLAMLAGIKPFLAGMPGDTSIASAALLNLALAMPQVELGTAITPHLSAKDVVAQPLKIVDGHLHARDLHGNGLGIEVDPALVEALAD
jgi:L-alanine-DL-glutamate epimerase-like enolase superfamily enzyme